MVGTGARAGGIIHRRGMDMGSTVGFTPWVVTAADRSLPDCQLPVLPIPV